MRDNMMVIPFFEYYTFRLYILESNIKHAPARGSPNIVPEDCSEFRKSDFVVDAPAVYRGG